MGMPITVDVRDDAATADDVESVFAELRAIDALFSPFKETSAVSRINSGTLALSDAPALLADVLDLCRRYGVLTHGYFDPWHEGRLDPSGLVKGWALARGAAILDRLGHLNYFVDGAGDVRTRGSSGDGHAWRVGIRHPVERDKVARVVLAHDLAVATSGTYEKGAHIYDPHTGRAVTDFVSLTVVGPDILTADVFATAAFAMGPEGLAFVAEQDGYEAFAITPDLEGISTSGFDALCA
jgi:thiamine biosynthesis lipoprotein